MPEPYEPLSLATMGESQGTGVGAGGCLAGRRAGFRRSLLAEESARCRTGVSAVGFGSPSGGGVEGDLGSSGMARNAQTSGSEGYGENVNFYQLERCGVNELGEEK